MQPIDNFSSRIYNLLRQVPAGKVTTYKDLAHAAGTKAYRAVGVAMKNNPYAPEVPCHRVVRADGTIGGFKGEIRGKAIDEKIEMLKKEGLEIDGRIIKNFENIRYAFNYCPAKLTIRP